LAEKQGGFLNFLATLKATSLAFYFIHFYLIYLSIY